MMPSNCRLLYVLSWSWSEEAVCFAGCCYVMTFQVRFYNYFRGGGHQYDCSGRDGIFKKKLNKNYLNVNSTHMNVSSDQLLVLILGQT